MPPCQLTGPARLVLLTSGGVELGSWCDTYPANGPAAPGTETFDRTTVFSHSSKARPSPHPSALFQPCLRPSERVPVRSVPSKLLSAAVSGFDAPSAAGSGFDAPSAAFAPPALLGTVLTRHNGPGRARTVTNRAGTALTGAVRTGLKSKPILVYG